MTDPVAEAAAQLAAQAAPEQPGIISEIVDEFKALGEKVEHLIHPDASVQNEPAAGAEQVSSGSGTSAPTVSETEGDAPNVAPAAAEQPAMPSSVPVVPMPGGIVGIEGSSVAEDMKYLGAIPVTTSAGKEIRKCVAAIKQHLKIRGFELSAVADIHAELDAIEKWL